MIVREVLRAVVLSPYVLLLLGIVLALSVLPGGDWMLSNEQKRGQEAQAQFERQLIRFDRNSIATEIGAAQAYAQGCDMEINSETMASIMALFSISPDDLREGGTQRQYWSEGVARAGSLLARDGGWNANRNLTCSVAVAGYGAGGAVIPSLLFASR